MGKSNPVTFRKPKILYWDVETSHIMALIFSLFGKNAISHNNIMSDWFIICACWQWEGEKKIHATSVLDDLKKWKEDPFDDYVVIKKLHDILSQADIVVAHNGDAFDMKKFNTRCIYHKLPPIPPVRSIDTLRVARGKFKFTSNRLDYIGQFLGLGGKLVTPGGLWQTIVDLRNDPMTRKKAIKSMVTYCKRDISLLKDVAHELLPYSSILVTSGIFTEEGIPVCSNPLCCSEHIQKRGWKTTNAGKYQRYQCMDCGKWSHHYKSVKKNPIRSM